MMTKNELTTYWRAAIFIGWGNSFRVSRVQGMNIEGNGFDQKGFKGIVDAISIVRTYMGHRVELVKLDETGAELISREFEIKPRNIGKFF